MSNRLKRSIAMLVTLALVLALGTSVALASVRGTATSNLNKRSSPTTASSNKVGTISKGSAITVVSKVSSGTTYGSIKVVGDWYKLSDGSFVSADYVKLSGALDDEGDELPPDDEDELPPEDDDGEIPLDDDDLEVVEGDDGEITLDDDGEISLDDDEGEIPIDEDEEGDLPDDLDEEDIIDDDQPTAGTVNASSLNMRATPTSTGTVVAKLARNAVVTISGEYTDGDKVGSTTVKGNWYKVTSGGKTGYVSADYIKVSGEAGTGTSQTVTLPIRNTKTVYKTAKKVTVYKLPTTMASTNGTLASGSTVSVRKTIENGASFTGLSAKVSGKWYMIDTSKYIQAKDVTTSKSTSKSTVEIPLGTTLVTTDAVRQRTKPSTSAAQLGRLDKGASVIIVGAVLDGSTYGGAKVSGNWIQVKGGGFLSADYVALP